MTSQKKIIVAITGATGSILGVRILQALQSVGIESHLVLSQWGARTVVHETQFSLDQVRNLATVNYSERDLGAAISSGSFVTDGMIVAPCSTRSLSAIAHGHGDNLIHRAADVVLKERRRLVLVVRETPLSSIHLENMLKLSRLGAVIVPPMLAFYNHPRTVDDMVDQVVMRVLDQLDIHIELARRWGGVMSADGAPIGEEA